MPRRSAEDKEITFWLCRPHKGDRHAFGFALFARYTDTFHPVDRVVHTSLLILFKDGQERQMAKSSSSKGKSKVRKVMREHKAGELKSGSGKKVTSRKQAVAIALNEARKSGAKIPKKKSK
jgi:hypothetical protein